MVLKEAAAEALAAVVRLQALLAKEDLVATIRVYGVGHPNDQPRAEFTSAAGDTTTVGWELKTATAVLRAIVERNRQ